MSEKHEVICIVKNWRDTLLHDLASIATFVVMLGTGVYLDSEAMQWIGGFLWLLWVFGFATAIQNKSRMTIAQARKRLDELEAE
jgi:hypothetical protein